MERHKTFLETARSLPWKSSEWFPRQPVSHEWGRKCNEELSIRRQTQGKSYFSRLEKSAKSIAFDGTENQWNLQERS